MRYFGLNHRPIIRREVEINSDLSLELYGIHTAFAIYTLYAIYKNLFL